MLRTRHQVARRKPLVPGPAGTQSGLLLLASWAGLVLLWGLLAGQLVALREALTGQAGIGTILTRALPVWGEGTLPGPTIAGIVQRFRPQPLIGPVRVQPPAQSAEPAAPTPLTGVAERLTLPTPAVTQDTPTLLETSSTDREHLLARTVSD